MNRYVLVRYGELALKGLNRSFFEKTLKENLEYALKRIGRSKVRRMRGRLAAGPFEEILPAARALSKVFGVTSVSPALLLPAGAGLEEVEEGAILLVEEWISGNPRRARVTFKVETKRADKNYPSTSAEISARLGAALLGAYPRLEARMKDPDLKVVVDIRQEGIFLSTGRIPGPGGLPVGTQAGGILLLSGGIDSPVAGWLAMKRGMPLRAAHFDSYPYTSGESLRKVEDLASVLASWGGSFRLHIFPFTKVQEAVRDSCIPRYHTVLFRRMMHRIAQELALRTGAGALVTGESLGQVASQTLENLTAIDQAVRIPVLRPLITFDKQETVDLARRIGTFEISTRPYPDCCTVFTPDHPVIKGKTEKVLEEEEKYPWKELMVESFEGGVEKVF